MTEYTFHVSEPSVSSTSTSALLVTSDPILVYCQNTARTSQTTVGSIAASATVTQATSATTATNINNYGLTTIGSSVGVITLWLLDPPTRSGLVKLITSIATSTANKVTTASTATANFISTSTWLGMTITFQVPGDSVELVSLSTSQWLVSQRTAGILTT